MTNNRINPINDDIVTHIMLEKDRINYNKRKVVKDNEFRQGSYNKLVGNITNMTLRKYITQILKENNLNYKVSIPNSFIENCPVEWDLIIVKKDVNDTDDNIYKSEDCICIIEFKTSGLMPTQYKKITETFETPFGYITDIKKKTKHQIPFIYITIAESLEYFHGTKKYFDKMNGIKDTAFAFIDFYELQDNRKKFFEECNDFEKFMLKILNKR